MPVVVFSIGINIGITNHSISFLFKFILLNNYVL